MPRERDDWPAWKKRVDQRLDELFTLAAQRPALNRVQSGSFGVYDQDGDLILYEGDVSDSETEEPRGTGVLIQRPSGRALLTASRLTASPTYSLSIFNDDLLEAFGLDTESGQGLSNPWIAYPTPVSILQEQWPYTAQTTYTDMSWNRMRISHPKLYIFGDVFADASTTGKVRFMVNGTQVGAEVTASNQQFTRVDMNVGLPADLAAHSIVTMNVQGKVTAGTGKVKCQLYGVIGRQS